MPTAGVPTAGASTAYALRARRIADERLSLRSCSTAGDGQLADSAELGDSVYSHTYSADPTLLQRPTIGLSTN